MLTEALSPWLMPPKIMSGRRSANSSCSAIFTQSTGVPLHDHICIPTSSRRSLRRSGTVAENAVAKPDRADSGAHTMMSAMSRSMSMSEFIPLA